jgi:uncharacterized protein YdeI (YjbR/CyaY-like superfamily)
MAAVKKNKKELAAFSEFSPSHKREYVEWVTDARTDDTRDRRLATAIAWMAEGKSRHWKYQRA